MDKLRIAARVLTFALLAATACSSGHLTASPDAGTDGAAALDASTKDAPSDSPVEATSDTGACHPETCDLEDDDCNGSCDDVLGCRVGVTRSFDKSTGLHFYTTTDSEASCCGYSIEQQYAFYLYAAQQPSLAPYYRCHDAKGHFYTTDPTCGGQTVEGVMGYIATSASVCGSIPLYELVSASTGDRLYTTSSAEVASAQAGGYTLSKTSGYVWPAECGGASCTWSSPIHLRGSTRASKTGFPSAWYGFPIDGAQSMGSLSGTVRVDNAQSLFGEVLFILEYLPSGTCISGPWPSSTPEFGPPGARPLAQFIVKAPTQGSFSVPLNFTLPGGLPMSSCVLVGLNGGPVSVAHDVVSSVDLSLSFSAPQSPAQTVVKADGEFCYGQSWGCQIATTDDTKSFAVVRPISQAGHLVALYGNISDSTFDGTSGFGAPPAGAWTAGHDFYVYHGADCSSFGVASGPVGPGNYYASIPSGATHLLAAPQTGSGIGVAQPQLFHSFTGVSLAAGDCLVELWRLQGGGAFDNESQVNALVGP